MLLILLSWIYILFTTINLGFGLDKISKLHTNNFVITSVLGLFSTTILASVWAIFGRINFEFHLFLLVLNGFIFLRFKSNITAIYQSFYFRINKVSIALKSYLILISILILAQCATIPYLIDNESYYIQTIKWLNEYGFVKGLANLHIFLGQTSGWHITQSAFSFSFLYDNFNDLSGFCLLLGTVFAVLKLDSYFKNQNKNYLIVGILPLANILLFQFISSPSPDLPVYVLSFFAFFYFLENFKNPSPEKFTLLIILSIFILYIKPTSIAILGLPLFYLFQNFKILKSNLFVSFALGMLILALFITKNTIITGYPLYPTQLFSYKMYDFGVPKELLSFYFDETKLYGFFITQAEYNSLSATQLFLKWLTSNKVNAIFNSISIALIFISPYFIYKFFNKKSFWILYFIMIFQIILLFFTSPQFRFHIHFILVFTFIIFACFIKSKKIITSLLFLSTIGIIILLFFPINFSMLTQNKLILKNSQFQLNEVVFPHNNTKLNNTFQKAKIGNLNFNSPDKDAYFWTTGNGNLPCVNAKQIDYFKTYFNYIPQLRTNDSKDGFYSKKITNE